MIVGGPLASIRLLLPLVCAGFLFSVVGFAFCVAWAVTKKTLPVAWMALTVLAFVLSSYGVIQIMLPIFISNETVR